MPRFFIDTTDGDLVVVDREGVVLRDDQAARTAALAGFPDMAREVMPDGDNLRFAIRIRNSAGTVIYSAVLTLAGGWTNNGGDPVADDFKGFDRHGARGRPDPDEDKAR
jgi:hypothetical protein